MQSIWNNLAQMLNVQLFIINNLIWSDDACVLQSIGWMDEDFEFNEDAIMSDVSRQVNVFGLMDKILWLWGKLRFLGCSVLSYLYEVIPPQPGPSCDRPSVRGTRGMCRRGHGLRWGAWVRKTWIMQNIVIETCKTTITSHSTDPLFTLFQNRQKPCWPP